MLGLDLGIANFTKGKIDKKLIKEAVFKTLKVLKVSGNIEVSLAFIGDAKMKNLNKKFRGKNKSTDVLSFGFDEKNAFKKGKKSKNLGEIMISLPYAKKQAKENKKSLKEEIALLSSHGTIHLCGIDHERSKKEYKKMEEVQNKVLKSIFK